MASEGNFDSISQVLGQNHVKTNWDDAIHQHSTREKFVQAVHFHFSSKFGAQGDVHQKKGVPTELGTDLDHTLMPASPFNVREVADRVGKMKPRKTSGPSGMSTDFLKALILEPQGLDLLAQHMNRLLTGKPLNEHRVAASVLIPKTPNISSEKQFRPIALMEVMHKLYMSLFISRARSTWHDLTFNWEGIQEVRS